MFCSAEECGRNAIWNKFVQRKQYIFECDLCDFVYQASALLNIHVEQSCWALWHCHHLQTLLQWLKLCLWSTLVIEWNKSISTIVWRTFLFQVKKITLLNSFIVLKSLCLILTNKLTSSSILLKNNMKKNIMVFLPLEHHQTALNWMWWKTCFMIWLFKCFHSLNQSHGVKWIMLSIRG